MLSTKLQYSLILVITLSLCKFSIGFKCNAKANLNRQFDTLLFVQQWPATLCKSWMKDGKECKVPPQKGIWTIHGIWPTRLQTNVVDQPSCCDSTIDLNADDLGPIRVQLKRYWPSIQKDRPDEDFWQYEWLKHGTCSVSIDVLDSSQKYFNQALFWLARGKIRSVQETRVSEFFNQKDTFTENCKILNTSFLPNCRRHLWTATKKDKRNFN